MTLRALFVWCVTLAACRDSHTRERAKQSPLETEIARQLTARFATPATVTCPGPKFLTCTATLADHTNLPIVIAAGKSGDAEWRVDGIVVDSKTIAAYVKDQLDSLKVADRVDCGPPVQVAKAGDRLRCALSGGGAAFVQIAADGQATLELALDKAAAEARGEPVTPQRDQELTARSKALESEGDSDGEEEAATADGGVAQP